MSRGSVAAPRIRGKEPQSVLSPDSTNHRSACLIDCLLPALLCLSRHAASMSHLEYQTQGPYASNGGSAAASTTGSPGGPGLDHHHQQQQQQQQQYNSHSQSQHGHSQSQSQPQHPDYPGQNHSHSRPPPPHFHDGLMQHQHQQQHHPHNFSPAASYPGELPCLAFVSSLPLPTRTSLHFHPVSTPFLSPSLSTMTLPPLTSPAMSCPRQSY